MDITAKILKYIENRKSAQGSELVRLLGISRQALNKHLQELISDGKVIKEGKTKGVKYYYAKIKKKTVQKFHREYKLDKLQEDLVCKDINLSFRLKQNLRKNVLNIFNYAFTEILNNVIEHSQTKKCDVKAELAPYQCNFKIRDYGIGIFYSIFTKFGLSDENMAVGELIKGEKTVMPERHTGEGVFFTSKSADIVNFRSHNINLIFDNIRQDIFLEEKKFIKGTEVNFKINTNSKRALEKIFNLYAPKEFGYRFEKTKVMVRLFQAEYISRSEARRLLVGLDKFKKILLDFKGVKSVGQGFADEIFRVFQKEHPDIVITIENLKSPLKSIIKHVVDNRI